MRQDEKSLLKRLAHLEEKLASLGEPHNATQRRLKTLWQHKLNLIKRMLSVFSGQDRRTFTLQIKRKTKRVA